MEFNDSTIILRVGSFREADLWVRLLSASRGIFSAFAFGGSKSRKRFSGCLDLFNEVAFQVRGGKGQYLTLQEGVLLKGPDRLRKDWRRLGIAVNCSLFLESFFLNIDGAAKVHDLFTQLLNTLESSENIPAMLPIFFRARMAFEQGYGLNLKECPLCGSSFEACGRAVLPEVESGLVCQKCAQPGWGNFSLGMASLAVLRHIMEAPVSEWHAISATEGAQKECARAIDSFLRHNTGVYWDKGRFRKG